MPLDPDQEQAEARQEQHQLWRMSDENARTPLDPHQEQLAKRQQRRLSRLG